VVLITRGKEIVPEVLKDLVAFEREHGSGGFDKWLLPVFSNFGLLYVMREGGDLVGTAQLMRVWERPDAICVAGIAVRKDRRGEGLGTLLMSHILKDLKRDGFNEVRLTVSPENTAAMKIYCDKMGFKKRGMEKDFYGEGEDRLVLVKQLKEVTGE
jgi:ribosomal-protein-alanine N-acetyltransferase